MKITHNKIGQNLNISDSKTEKTGKSDSAKSAKGIGSILDIKSKSTDAADAATKVDVSPRAQEAKRIKELAMAAPDVDMEKVEKFRKLIDEGKYKVDSRAVADKMVDEQLATNTEMD